MKTKYLQIFKDLSMREITENPQREYKKKEYGQLFLIRFLLNRRNHHIFPGEQQQRIWQTLDTDGYTKWGK